MVMQAATLSTTLTAAPWRVVRAQTIGNFKGGNGFPLQYQGKAHGLYPYFKVSDMNNVGNERVLKSANNYIDEGIRRFLGAHAFPEDTIVFAKVGAAVFLERKRRLVAPSCIDNNLAGFVVSDPEVDPRYIHHFFESVKFSQLVSTTALPSLNNSVLNAIEIRLPPTKHEQARIAEALSDADALIEELERLIAKKRAIKQSVMCDLLTGRKRLPGFSEIWPQKALEDVSAFITKGSTPTTYGFGWTSSGIRFLRSECVAADGLDLTESMWISEDAHKLLRRSEIIGGDILVTITGNVGRVVQLPQDFGVANINQHIARIRISDPQICPAFVAHVLNQETYRMHYASILTGQAYPQISLRQVRETLIPSPVLAEQRAIAELLSDMDSDLFATEGKLAKAQQLKAGMMRELLTGRARLA